MVVISGRELDDLRRKVDVDGLTYAACHGLHVMHADGQTYRHTISQGKSKYFLSLLVNFAFLAMSKRFVYSGITI